MCGSLSFATASSEVAEPGEEGSVEQVVGVGLVDIGFALKGDAVVGAEKRIFGERFLVQG